MKKLIKKFDFLVMGLVIILLSAVLVSCQNTETKKVETETTTMPAEGSMERKDTLPALDKDSAISTKPETIKNH